MKSESKTSLLARHPLGAGAVFWVVFSVVAVAIRGVRWDENYEFAQAILGQVPYPDGHPLYQYVRSLFSLQPQSLAALMYFAPGPFWANAIRNVLFLASSTIPVYLWGHQLSRRPLIGHCAVVFVLLEIHVAFYSSYPIHVWPSIFSNGPVGLGYMLVALWALASHRHRLAGLLLGFAPIVHLGQFPPLLATWVLYIAWNLVQHRHQAIKQLLLFAVPGFVASIALGLFLKGFAPPPPTEGPYFTHGDPMAFWRTYMERYASHRAIPFTTGHLVLAGSLLTMLYWLTLRRLRSKKRAKPAEKVLETPMAWAGIYLIVATSTVWIIMAIQYVLGADTPYLLVGWLPYRLMNHIAPLLVPILLTMGMGRGQKVPQWLPPLLLIALIAPLLDVLAASIAPLMETLSIPFVPVLNGVLETSLADRYITSGAYLFFFLYGASTSVTVIRIGHRKRAWGIGAGAGLMVSLATVAWFHQFGAACFAFGTLTAFIPALPRLSPRIITSIAAGLVGIILCAMLAEDYERREHLYISPFYQEVAAYLEHQGEEDAMILVPHQQVGMQMKTGHPVMTDMITLLIAAYRPTIAPAVNAVFQDFYGLSLDPDSPDTNLAWHEVWPQKPMEEWQRLSKKYDVRYVIAPTFMKLRLRPAVVGRTYHLYRLPATQ